MVNELGVLEVVQKPTRSADQQVYSLLQPHALHFPVHASDQQSDCLVMKLSYLFGHIEHLDSQFSSWSDNNDSSPVDLFEL